MGHYRSEMYSPAELDAEVKAKDIRERTAKIQKAIDEKGIARFLAEMEVSTYSGKVSIW